MKRFILLTVFIFAVSSAKSETIKANSGSRQDIQNAINTARKGDTILVPAGTYNFSGRLNMPSGITLMGAGIDNTILQRTNVSTDYMVQVNCANGEPFRITGFTFIGTAPNDGNGIRVINNSYGFQIDHNKFINFHNWAALEFYFADFRGLVDHNEFIDNMTNSIYINGNRDEGWTGTLSLGTDDAVFIEDNYFRQTDFSNSYLSHHLDGQYGAKWVFRYNTIEDETIYSQTIGAHGAYVGSSENRGNRSFEIYNNTMTAVDRHRAIKIRGGDGVIYNNVIDGNYNSGGEIHIKNEDANTGEGDNCSYPCLDQIRSLYIWNNTSNGATTQVYNQHPSIIKEDRDYFLQAKPGYSPFTYPHPLADGTPLPLRISTSNLPGALVDTPYSAQLSASGGQTPYQWQIISGGLPNGLDLVGDAISGTPNEQDGSYTFTIEVTDAEGTIASQALTLILSTGVFSSIPYFGDAQNWQPNNPNDWAVQEQDGEKRFVITASSFPYLNGVLPAYSLIKDRVYSDFAIALKVKSPKNLTDSEADNFALVFAYQDVNNYYYMLFNSNAPWSVLHKLQDGSRTDIHILDEALITDNDYHDIELIRSGTTITVKKDTRILFTAQDGTFGAGQLGIGTFSDPVLFDDIEVSENPELDTLAPAPPQNVQITQE